MTNEEIKEKVKSIFKEGDRVFTASIYSSSWGTLVKLADNCVWFHIEGLNETVQVPYMAVLKHFSFTEYTLEQVGFSQERPKPKKKKNGDPFEVGDEVWMVGSEGILPGRVDCVMKHEKYPIIVESTSIGDYKAFTIDGRNRHEHPVTLFHQKPVITFED